MKVRKLNGRVIPAALALSLAAAPAMAYGAEDGAVFVAEPGNPYDAATWDKIHDNVLEYDEIGLLVEEYNTTYKNLRETYEDNKNASDNVVKLREQLSEQSGDLLSQANSLADTAASVRDVLG